MNTAYLASPYSPVEVIKNEPAVRAIKQERYELAQRACMELLIRRIAVFSPIAYWHPIDVALGLGEDFSFYREMDFIEIKQRDWFILLMTEGWLESVGMKEEFHYAKHLEKQIYIYSPVDYRLKPTNITRYPAKTNAGERYTPWTDSQQI